jgi:excisionase family DNA binding protein
MQTTTSNLLTTAQAAELLGVKISTVWRWCRSRKLPHIRLSLRNYKFRLNDIEEFILNQRR